MKVLQIINSLDTGGAEKLIIETVPLMIQAGHEVDVLLINGKNTPFLEELKKIETLNIFKIHKGFTNYTPYLNPLLILRLKQFIKNEYNIIHVHLFPSQYHAAFTKLLFNRKAKLIFTEHSTENRRMNNPLLKWIDKLIYKSYERVICITDGVRINIMQKLGIENNKLTIIENGINIRDAEIATATDRSEFNYKANDVIIIMVAGFRPQKDQDTLIEAMKELPSHYKLLLVGDGARRKYLESLIESLELENKVHLTGVRTDVYSLTKMADIAVVSSHSEGFGLVAAEAMACGTPVIASNVKGLAQIVEGGGILFERGNIEDLQSKIISLTNPELYKEYVDLGLQKAKQYSIETMVSKLLSSYDEVIRNEKT